MMQVLTLQFTIFGYPGIVMIFFFITAVGGLFFALMTVVGDERVEKKSGRRNTYFFPLPDIDRPK
jgi:hypothetical protein